LSDLEQEQLSAIIGGDEHAFGQWMVDAEPTIRLSLHSFAAVVDTEAVVQETLLRVWQVAPRFRNDGQPRGLIRLGVRIARNLAISETRKSRSIGADEDELGRRLAEDSPPAPTPDPFLRKAIEDCRDKLPGKPLSVLTARLGSAGGDADATLAAGLGMTANTFLQNFTRARKFLLSCLEEQGIQIGGATR
jgi:RNA polymerase sigma-70 factor (ECF subfamily)